jgi:DNA polymerase III delta subunit
MKYNEALQAMEFGRERRFALVGNEQYLKVQFISTTEKSRKAMLSEFWPDGEDDALAALSGGLFDDDSIIVLYNVEAMNLPRLAEVISKSDRFVLAVFSEDVNLKTRTVSSFLGKMAPVECMKFREYGNEFPAWVSAKISSAGYVVDEGVVHSICTRVGTDMLTIDCELQKLFILKEKDKHIELSDVDKAVSITSTRTAYDILDGLIKGDIMSALSSLEAYPSKGNYVEIVAFLFTYMEKMYRMILLRDRKHSVDAIADILGVPKFLVGSKYLPKALALGKGFLIKQMGKLCDLDINIRSFKGDKKALVERFIYGFAPVV